MSIVERYKVRVDFELNLNKKMKKNSIGNGRCCYGKSRAGDLCLIILNRTRVEVTNIYYEEIETDSCVSVNMFD